jgi:hypothetical protein
MLPEVRERIESELEQIRCLQAKADGLRWKLAVFAEALRERAAQTERLKDWWRERRRLFGLQSFTLRGR